jgi:hypothetical protein
MVIVYPNMSSSLNKELGGLPSGIRQRVRGVLEEIEGINKTGWFPLRTIEETDKLIPEIKPRFKKLIEAVRGFKGSDDTWKSALQFARDSVWDLAQESGRGDYYHMVWEIARNTSLSFIMRGAAEAISGDNRRDSTSIFTFNNLVKNTGVVASRAATWEVVSDLPIIQEARLQSPDHPILELYGLGLMFVDFRFFNHEQVPVAHQVTKLDDSIPDRYLFCVAANQSKVNLMHPLDKVCKEGVPIGRVIS